jgi:hypothetical protein
MEGFNVDGPDLRLQLAVLELCASEVRRGCGETAVRLGGIVGLRSKSRKDAKLIAAIHRTGFFDAAYYLANNPAWPQTGLTRRCILLSGVGRRGASLALSSTQRRSNWVRFAKTLYHR